MRYARWLKRLACLAALLCLCSCSMPQAVQTALQTPSSDPSALPDLRQLSMPAAQEDPYQAAGQAGQAAAMQVDLWLDASQVMGGVNPDPDSIYPHRSNRYREGGFHYRYNGNTGWYENLLQDMLAAAEGSRIRVLRCGNEQISDELLLTSGLAADDSAETLRSLRRDLLTYAIDPMPTLFSDFSAESMDGSFYALYTPKMNQMARFAPSDGALLENSGQVEQMSALLDELISSYKPKQYQQVLSQLLTPAYSPLTCALDNLDSNRLSVITCDPLTLRRLSGTAVDGSPVSYLEQILQERGIFDRGLSVQLYAFQLDYMGQIHTINAADLSQPLIWGRLDYNPYTKKTSGELPMPRILLTLIVGAPSYVDTYTTALNAKLDSDPALKGLRGPDEGQLTYARDGQVVTQQPFSFAYHTTQISRHSVEVYTLSTPGAQISLTKGEGGVLTDAAQPTVALSYGQSGSCEITVEWPVAAMEGGLTMDGGRLPALEADGVATLLLTDVQANLPDTPLPGGDVQTLILRDNRYHFTLSSEAADVPFTAGALHLSQDGTRLIATLTADCDDLTPGYYRLRLHADVTGEQLSWPAVDWVEALNANITNQQISSWQLMADALDEHHRAGGSAPSLFWHAWGDTPGETYKGVTIPDCPPVYAAPRLSELLTQLQNAAQIDTLPLVYAQLDVFVAPAAQLGL